MGTKGAVAFARALIYSSSMPGFDRDDPTGRLSEAEAGNGGGGGSDPMQKAANTLLRAAEALLKLAQGGGGAGGGGRSLPLGAVLGSDDPDLFVRADRLYSASQVSNILRPGRIGTDSTGFVEAVARSMSLPKGKKGEFLT